MSSRTGCRKLTSSETGLLDSLKLVELPLHVETRFGMDIFIDDLEVTNFRSIARIVEFLQARSVTTSSDSEIS
jgi:acyl carrier protein